MITQFYRNIVSYQQLWLTRALTLNKSRCPLSTRDFNEGLQRELSRSALTEILRPSTRVSHICLSVYLFICFSWVVQIIVYGTTTLRYAEKNMFEFPQPPRPTHLLITIHGPTTDCLHQAPSIGLPPHGSHYLTRSTLLSLPGSLYTTLFTLVPLHSFLHTSTPIASDKFFTIA